MSKILKIMTLLIAMSALSFNFYSQDSSENSESQFVLDNVEEVQTSSLDQESTIALDFEETEESTKGASGELSFFVVLRVVFVLVIIVALIYVLLFFLRKSVSVDPGDDKFLRQVASINLAPGKSVQVVTLTDKFAFLVGVSDNSVNLISKIDDVELVQAMNLYSDSQKKTSKPKNFQDILDIFMPNGPRSESGVFSGVKNQASDFLKKQRDRLNGGE
ncbi:MAG: flagellar biosynthetic protein FliO [Treponema sp.]|nr:flagellar biosynthetic protein FliO [Treponema sp.]